MTPQKFRSLVWAHYRKAGRHDLPWRKTKDPYRILVSEVMLQQTQVERVIPFYTNWMKKFPTARKLSSAPLSDVLKAWQGLGYNRRAKALHMAAKEIVKKGSFPKTAEELEKLPGIGPYTARAVMAFAYNADVIFIETNIRTAVTHHFFPRKEKVDDKEILEILEKVQKGLFKSGQMLGATKRKDEPYKTYGEALGEGSNNADGLFLTTPREWYGALMDYGAHLKKSGVRLNAKAKGYAKQSTFEGSGRQARGSILRELAKAPAGKAKLLDLLGTERKQQVADQLEKLLAEGMVERRGRFYALPD